MKKANETLPAGADFSEEGQRLLAKRRGPLLRWVNEHPGIINVALVVMHLLSFVVGSASQVLAGDSDAGQAPGLSQGAQLLLVVSLGILFSLGIFWRNRYSLWLLLASGVVDLIAVAFPLNNVVSGATSWVFMYTLGSREPFRRGLLGCILYSLMAISTQVLLYLRSINNSGDLISVEFSEGVESATTDFPYIAGDIISIALFYITLFLVGRAVHRNRMFEQALLAGFKQNQVLAAAEERNRIAREMHDVIAHSLTVMITLADGARFVAAKNPEKAGEVLQELSTTGRTALADMRRTLGVLRSDEGEDARLAPAEGAEEKAVDNLRVLTESFASTGMKARFVHEGQEIPSDNNLRLSLYRIVQESLTNALRYGQNTQHISVKVEVNLPDIWLTIINDGSLLCDSLPPSIGSGKGIAGMRERAAFYGGTVQASPHEEGGWQVKAHLAWNNS
ncbi:sensor histidine kinase [Rothia sp. ZJ1223]|uniref:sensor histidine kinase n=1 Tax=Rothia sp. ZJ1223 TaxID=2811098 RepID=UPI00195DB4C3|nr:histidine kinase [Rothia sp. ZJ1223]MBM7051820.1 hypothetical protein [Rothia sp. ZJ1223]